MRLPCLLALATLPLAPLVAHAQWPAGGKFIADPSNGYGIGTVWILDLPGGDLAVVSHGKNPSVYNYTVQRVSPEGGLGAGWLVNGVPLGHTVSTVDPFGFAPVVDDSSVVWQGQIMHSPFDPEPGTRALFVGPDGTRIPGSGSFSLSSLDDLYIPLASAPRGVYASFAGSVRRILRSGASAPGWPATGLAFGSRYMAGAALADGAGGVIALTTLGPGNRVTLQRFDSTAVRNAAWPVAGVQPSDLPLTSTREANIAMGGAIPALLPSGAGHFIAAWQSDSLTQVRLQRISLTGVRDPDWPSTAVLAAYADTALSGISVLPDRSGGAYVTWYLRGLPRATHVRANGTFEPGTDAAGVLLVPAGGSYEAPLQFITKPPYVPADVTPDGRLMFAWDEAATSDFRVRWLLPDLTADPSEPLDGRVVTPAVGNSTMRTVHADPVGGAYLAWHSRNMSVPFNDPGETWMTRVLPSALLDAPRPAPSGGLLLSAARPNPARNAIALELTLASDTPARLELLDVAGRTLRAQTVAGAGRHSLAFTDLRGLPPGLYFVRATAGGVSQRARVVLTR